MKQVILILSFIIAAFVAACAKDSKSLKLLNGGEGTSSKKTIEQLKKASSEDELKKFKSELDANDKLQVIDVIAKVKYKFGNPVVATGQTGAEQAREKIFNDESKDGSESKDEERASSFEKLKKQNPESTDTKNPNEKINQHATIEMAHIDDATKIYPVDTDLQHIRYMCVRNCDVQIAVVRNLTEQGKVQSVNAFVLVKLDGTNLKHYGSEQTSHVMNALTAVYDASDSHMLLKFDMKTGKRYMTSTFLYSGKEASGSLVSTTGFNEGSYEVAKVNGTKAVRLAFKVGYVDTLLVNDLGLFGKNPIASSKDTVEKNKDDKRTEKEKLASEERRKKASANIRIKNANF